MPACSAYGCSLRPERDRKTGVTFHRFPSEPHQRRLWIDAVQREHFVPSKTALLCSRHFREEDIDRSSLSVVRIRENAVPSIFPSNLQKKQKHKKPPKRSTSTFVPLSKPANTSGKKAYIHSRNSPSRLPTNPSDDLQNRHTRRSNRKRKAAELNVDEPNNSSTESSHQQNYQTRENTAKGRLIQDKSGATEDKASTEDSPTSAGHVLSRAEGDVPPLTSTSVNQSDALLTAVKVTPILTDQDSQPTSASNAFEMVTTSDQGACPDQPGQKISITVTEDSLVQQWLLVGTLEKLTEDSDIAQFLLALYFSADKNSGKEPKLSLRCASCKSSLMPLWRCLRCQRQFAFSPGDGPVSKIDPVKLAQQWQDKQIDGLTPPVPAFDQDMARVKVGDSGLIRAGLYQTIASLNIESKSSSKQAHLLSDTITLTEKTACVNPAMPSTTDQKNTQSVRVVLAPNSKLPPNFPSPPNIILPQSIDLLNSASKNTTEQVKSVSNTPSLTPNQKTAEINLAKNVAIPITIGQNKTPFVKVLMPTNVKLPQNIFFQNITKVLPTDVTNTLPHCTFGSFLVPLTKASSSSLPQMVRTSTGQLSAEGPAVGVQDDLNKEKTPTEEIQCNLTLSLREMQSLRRKAYKRQMEDLMLQKERLRKQCIEEEKIFRKAHPKQHQCNYCQKIVRSNYCLQEHIAAKHTKPRHVCELCNKVFLSRSALNIHIQRHTGQRPYLCEICAKRFYLPGALKSHLDLHLGHKPHLCTDCGKGFTQASSLASHMRTHAQVKKFVCNICGRAFAWAANMRSHRRRHENSNYRPKIH